MRLVANATLLRFDRYDEPPDSRTAHRRPTPCFPHHKIKQLSRAAMPRRKAAARASRSNGASAARKDASPSTGPDDFEANYEAWLENRNRREQDQPTHPSIVPKILRAVKKVARKTPGGRFKKIRKEIALLSFFLKEDEFGFPNYKIWYDCKTGKRRTPAQRRQRRWGLTANRSTPPPPNAPPCFVYEDGWAGGWTCSSCHVMKEGVLCAVNNQRDDVQCKACRKPKHEPNQPLPPTPDSAAAAFTTPLNGEAVPAAKRVRWAASLAEVRRYSPGSPVRSHERAREGTDRASRPRSRTR